MVKNGVLLLALLSGLLVQQAEVHARGWLRQMFSRGGHVSSSCVNGQCGGSQRVASPCANGKCGLTTKCENGVCTIVPATGAAADNPATAEYVKQLEAKFPDPLKVKPDLPPAKTAETNTDDKSVASPPVGLPPDEVSVKTKLEADQVASAVGSIQVDKVETWSVEDYLLQQTNHQRVIRGLRPLRLCRDLLQTAREHSWWMARNRIHRHGTRYQRHGSSENIAMSSADAADAMNMWMNSSGHRAAILNGGYTRLGVAAYTAPNGVTYFTQHFGR